MLVCPHCRNENREEAQFCSTCGRTLAPQVGAQGPTRRAETEDPLDLPPPKPPSAVPAIVVGSLLALSVLAAIAWMAFRPDPCEGKYRSVFYPYCVEIPEGWGGGSQLNPNAPNARLDAYRSEDEGVVVVVRSQDVPTTTQAEAYAQVFRTFQEAQNASPGRLEGADVGGDVGLAWDASAETEDGRLHLREVVIVREGQGWRITLQTDEAQYQEARLEFERMLESWAWA